MEGRKGRGKMIFNFKKMLKKKYVFSSRIHRFSSITVRREWGSRAVQFMAEGNKVREEPRQGMSFKAAWVTCCL